MGPQSTNSLNAPAFFGQCRAKTLVVLENFFAFGLQNLVLIFMVLRGPTPNITGVILVIDVIKVADEFFY
jgi:hypothetical protein